MDDNKVSTETPNPGSDEAIELGCTCPVLDNGHGQGLGNGLFWINEDCPVHAPKKNGETFEERIGVLHDEMARLRKSLRSELEVLCDCLKDGEE